MAKPSKQQSTFVEQFLTARRTSTPLVAVATADPAAAMLTLHDADAFGPMVEGPDEARQFNLPEDHAAAHVYRWDAQNGLQPAGQPAQKSLEKIAGDVDVLAATANFRAMVHFIQRLPSDAVVFALNAHRALDVQGDDGLETVQGVWNLRDKFKENFRMLVLMMPHVSMPDELIQDVMVLHDELPDDARLESILRERLASANLPKPTPEQVVRGVNALRGLAAYPAEQGVAMSLTKEGIDLPMLWTRKRSTVDQVPGLRVLRGIERYADVLDVDAAVEYCRRIQAGPDAPAVIVQVEEIEKAMAGAQTDGGDSSGVAQDRLSVVLDRMEECGWTGMIFYGVPGAGKSLLSKAVANESEALAIRLDLGALSDKHVGTSEARVRRAMDTIYAAGGRRVMFTASCNKMTTLPPELKRRFTLGVWFFDLPSVAGVAKMWAANKAKYGIAADAPVPDATNWTGADVRNACDAARRLRITPREAARYIVPVAKSDPQMIAAARAFAEGRLLCAQRGGEYVPPDKRQAVEVSASRRALKV